MVLFHGLDLGSSRKVAVIGEAGSGKTELSLNLALELRERTGGRVCLLDMDQSKPLFRARDAAGLLRERGVEVPVQPQFMDAPVVPHGVLTRLLDPELYLVLDVGGNLGGAACLGQYAGAMEAAGAAVLYAINRYRCFSDSTGRVQRTMESILAQSGLGGIRVVSNPYLGPGTSWGEVLEGNRLLGEVLAPLGLGIFATMVPAPLWEERKGDPPGAWVPVRPWMSRVLDLCPP